MEVIFAVGGKSRMAFAERLVMLYMHLFPTPHDVLCKLWEYLPLNLQ